MTRCLTSSETIRAKKRIPARRAIGGLYSPSPPSRKREPTTMSASPRSTGARSFGSSAGTSSIGALASAYYAVKVMLAVFVALSRRYATPLEEDEEA